MYVLARRHNGPVGFLVGVLAGGFFLIVGIATIKDYRHFGTWIVKSIPGPLRIGTIQTHRRFLGVGYSALGSVIFLIEAVGLIAHLS